MHKSLKMITGILCSALFISSGCNKITNSDAPQQKQEVATNDVSALNWKVTDFEFVDHNGRLFGSKDLKGKVWLADFVFTRCPNVCPPMTAKMVELQKVLKEQHNKQLIVPTVSFSVDPKHDKPTVLKTFAEEHGAEFTNWHFLTGYDQKRIQEMAQACFKGIVEPQKQPSKKYEMLINHPSLFYLVDKSGKVVRYYDGLNPDIEQIVKDINQLIKA